MTLPLLKRFIAVLLPLSFVWVFVACVEICERETLASHPPTDFTTSNRINEIRHERECDGCPLSYFPKATTPEQVRSSSDSISSLALAIPSIDSYHPIIFSSHVDRPVFDASPPLKLPPPLRI